MAILLSFVYALILSIVVYVDRLTIGKLLNGNGSQVMAVCASISSTLTIPFFYFLNPNIFSISQQDIWIVLISGFIFIFSLLPMYLSYQTGDSSVLVPLQLTGFIFNLVLGWLFLGENLSSLQFIGCGLIVLGVLGLSLKLGNHKLAADRRSILLMLLGTFLMSTSYFLFKFTHHRGEFWSLFWLDSFWRAVGTMLAGLVLLLIPKMRARFLEVIKIRRGLVIGMSVSNETLATLANGIYNIAIVMAPLALINATSRGLLAILVLLNGYLLTKFLPKLVNEDISRKSLIRKMVFVVVIIVGTIVVSFQSF